MNVWGIWYSLSLTTLLSHTCEWRWLQELSPISDTWFLPSGALDKVFEVTLIVRFCFSVYSTHYVVSPCRITQNWRQRSIYTLDSLAYMLHFLIFAFASSLRYLLLNTPILDRLINTREYYPRIWFSKSSLRNPLNLQSVFASNRHTTSLSCS